MRYFKYILLSVVTMLTALPAAAQWQNNAMPPFLKAGDRVAVISPCSQPSIKVLENGCNVLRQWGFEPVTGPNVTKNYHGFAGTVEQRTSDLLWALRDTTCKAIICTRGGDGGIQLLPSVPLKEFRRNPKWLIGFSDITALHSASVVSGVMSIHGPMLQTIASQGGKDTVSATLQKLLMGELPQYHIDHNEMDQQGQAEGMLVGGNLTVFCALAGSSYDFLNLKQDLILFVEDTDESIRKVDRMLHNIVVRGLMPRIKGIIVGHFTSYCRNQDGFKDMYHMLHEYLRRYNIPVCYGFPTGHARPNFPLIEGCRVNLNVGAGGTDLTFIP